MSKRFHGGIYFTSEKHQIPTLDDIFPTYQRKTDNLPEYNSNTFQTQRLSILDDDDDIESDLYRRTNGYTTKRQTKNDFGLTNQTNVSKDAHYSRISPEKSYGKTNYTSPTQNYGLERNYQTQKSRDFNSTSTKSYSSNRLQKPDYKSLYQSPTNYSEQKTFGNEKTQEKTVFSSKYSSGSHNKFESKYYTPPLHEERFSPHSSYENRLSSSPVKNDFENENKYFSPSLRESKRTSPERETNYDFAHRQMQSPLREENIPTHDYYAPFSTLDKKYSSPIREEERFSSHSSLTSNNYQQDNLSPVNKRKQSKNEFKSPFTPKSESSNEEYDEFADEEVDDKLTASSSSPMKKLSVHYDSDSDEENDESMEKVISPMKQQQSDRNSYTSPESFKNSTKSSLESLKSQQVVQQNADKLSVLYEEEEDEENEIPIKESIKEDVEEESEIEDDYGSYVSPIKVSQKVSSLPIKTSPKESQQENSQRVSSSPIRVSFKKSSPKASPVMEESEDEQIQDINDSKVEEEEEEVNEQEISQENYQKLQVIPDTEFSTTIGNESEIKGSVQSQPAKPVSDFVKMFSLRGKTAIDARMQDRVNKYNLEAQKFSKVEEKQPITETKTASESESDTEEEEEEEHKVVTSPLKPPLSAGSPRSLLIYNSDEEDDDDLKTEITEDVIMQEPVPLPIVSKSEIDITNNISVNETQEGEEETLASNLNNDYYSSEDELETPAVKQGGKVQMQIQEEEDSEEEEYLEEIKKKFSTQKANIGTAQKLRPFNFEEEEYEEDLELSNQRSSIVKDSQNEIEEEESFEAQPKLKSNSGSAQKLRNISLDDEEEESFEAQPKLKSNSGSSQKLRNISLDDDEEESFEAQTKVVPKQKSNSGSLQKLRNFNVEDNDDDLDASNQSTKTGSFDKLTQYEIEEEDEARTQILSQNTQDQQEYSEEEEETISKLSQHKIEDDDKTSLTQISGLSKEDEESIQRILGIPNNIVDYEEDEEDSIELPEIAKKYLNKESDDDDDEVNDQKVSIDLTTKSQNIASDEEEEYDEYGELDEETYKKILASVINEEEEEEEEEEFDFRKVLEEEEDFVAKGGSPVKKSSNAVSIELSSNESTNAEISIDQSKQESNSSLRYEEETTLKSTELSQSKLDISGENQVPSKMTLLEEEDGSITYDSVNISQDAKVSINNGPGIANNSQAVSITLSPQKSTEVDVYGYEEDEGYDSLNSSMIDDILKKYDQKLSDYEEDDI